MRRFLLGLSLLATVLAACGDHIGNSGNPDATVDDPDAALVDATPAIDATPPFTPRSGLYVITSTNFPNQATPENCSLAPSGMSAPTFITVAAGGDTLSLSLFGQTTVCVRTDVDFVCPTTVTLSFFTNAQVRLFNTITGTFSDEENWTSDNVKAVDCVGTECDARLGPSGVTEFPCSLPTTSVASFDMP